MTDTVPLVTLSEAERTRLDRFVSLVCDYLDGRMSAEQFEPTYFRLFQGDPTLWPDSIYEPLNEIFLDLDEYHADPVLRGDDPYAIGENELRRRVTIAFAALQLAQDVYAPRP